MPLVPNYISTLQPYKAGKPISEVQKEFGLKEVIKLASNENPLGVSPLAIEEAKKVLNDINFYPDGGIKLREILAEKENVKLENVIVGSGSESIMGNIIRTFLCDDEECLTTEFPFIGFRVLVQTRGVKIKYVPYKNWQYDLEKIANAINEKTKIIYLANPNNPTGTFFTKEEFDNFYKKVPQNILIILDEAYFEYAQNNINYPNSMFYRYDNVITLRTFSKAYGLAGIRIGYGFAHDELIKNLLKVKLPFEPSSIASASGIGALKDIEFLEKTIQLNHEGIKFLTSSLREIKLNVVNSVANFAFLNFDSEKKVNFIFQKLLEKGIIVRPLSGFGLSNCMRVSTGTMEQNEKFVYELKNIISKNNF